MTDHGAALADLLERERKTLLAEWRQRVRELPSAAHLSVPTLNDHVPQLIDELTEALRKPALDGQAKAAVRSASVEHGNQRVEDGYDIGEVVAEYSMLRGCIHTLAQIHGMPLRDVQVHILNGILDRAIGVAVQAFAVSCDLIERERREEHLAFIAHDLRTPLNAMALATRALEREGQSEEDRRRMFDVLKRNVRHMSTLIEDVLRNSGADLPDGRGTPRRRDVQLWTLVQELIEELQPTADHGATRLVNEVPDDLLAHVDAPMLRRVLQNLIANAIANSARGEVCIGARQLDGGAGVQCWVSDDGAGMSAEQRRKLLADSAAEPSARENGRGRGLLIVRAFVEAHGGELTIESTEGAGSTFSFSLPADSDPAS